MWLVLSCVSLLLALPAGAATPRAAEDASSVVEASAKPAPRVKARVVNKTKGKAAYKAKKPKAKVGKSRR